MSQGGLWISQGSEADDFLSVPATHYCSRERHQHCGACTKTPASQGSISACAGLTCLLWSQECNILWFVSPLCPHEASLLDSYPFFSLTQSLITLLPSTPWIFYP